jgi:membrane protease subunit HflC
VRKAVFNRMISERQRIAERYRAEGRGLKAEKDGERFRDEKRILSKAYRDAQTIIAAADAKAARIFADAYNLDPEFYAFWRTLKAYETIIGNNHTLVISPKSELYRFLASDGSGD